MWRKEAEKQTSRENKHMDLIIPKKHTKYLWKAWGKQDSSFEVSDEGQCEFRTRTIKRISRARLSVTDIQAESKTNSCMYLKREMSEMLFQTCVLQALSFSINFGTVLSPFVQKQQSLVTWMSIVFWGIALQHGNIKYRPLANSIVLNEWNSYLLHCVRSSSGKVQSGE